MAKIEIIGGRVFKPLELDFKEKIGATAIFAAAVLMGRYFVPSFSREYQSWVRGSRLLFFYGEDAFNRFIETQPPQPKESPCQLPLSRLLHLH